MRDRKGEIANKDKPVYTQVEKGQITLTSTKAFSNTIDELFDDCDGQPLGEEDKYECQL